jgi:thiamine-phosphate pyrophosphorylase
MAPSRPTPRLYLITPPVAEPAAFAPQLEAALGAGDVAAVLLRLAAADERTLINRTKILAETVQRRDVALLVDNRPGIVARAGADGAHVSGIEAFAAALALLKPDRIAGAGGLVSRHDAMLAAETGADYVMFGEPPPYPPPHAGEGSHHFPPPRAGEGQGGGPRRRMPFDDILERLTWWAELFEIPCVGYAASRDEVAPLAQTGADFIALGEWIWTEPQNTAATIAAAAQQLASAPVQAGEGDHP